MKRISRFFFIAFVFAILAGCATVTDNRVVFSDGPGGVHATMDDALLFAKNSATLNTQSDELFDVLKPYLERAKGKILVQGHTDSNGTTEVNKALSQARANAVKAALVKRGIAASRIEAKGYGSSKPVVKNAKTPAERQKNRRAVIVFVDETMSSMQ